jgi:hypothetical protein
MDCIFFGDNLFFGGNDMSEEKARQQPGYFTKNLPRLLPALAAVGLENLIVCANVNKMSYVRRH